MLFIVVIDDSMYAGRIDGAESALQSVVIDEYPAGVSRLQYFLSLGKGGEIIEGDKVGGGDVGVAEESCVLGPKANFRCWEVQEGDVERCECCTRRCKRAKVGVKQGGC